MSAVLEQGWLDVLYQVVRNGGDRVAILRRLADVRLSSPSEDEYLSMRYDHRGVSMMLTADQCFACLNSERWLYWHHVIQVQHGGSNTPRNLVRLCHDCHRRVHPWLPARTSVENRYGWTSVGDLSERVVTKLVERFEAPAPVRRSTVEIIGEQPF
jgi:hypothetical protein